MLIKLVVLSALGRYSGDADRGANPLVRVSIPKLVGESEYSIRVIGNPYSATGCPGCADCPHLTCRLRNVGRDGVGSFWCLPRMPYEASIQVTCNQKATECHTRQAKESEFIITC